jgi:hypothetical protein
MNERARTLRGEIKAAETRERDGDKKTAAPKDRRFFVFKPPKRPTGGRSTG